MNKSFLDIAGQRVSEEHSSGFHLIAYHKIQMEIYSGISAELIIARAMMKAYLKGKKMKVVQRKL